MRIYPRTHDISHQNRATSPACSLWRSPLLVHRDWVTKTSDTLPSLWGQCWPHGSPERVSGTWGGPQITFEGALVQTVGCYFLPFANTLEGLHKRRMSEKSCCRAQTVLGSPLSPCLLENAWRLLSEPVFPECTWARGAVGRMHSEQPWPGTWWVSSTW